jgi:hypothetical protein
MGDSLFALPTPAPDPQIAEVRARTEAARCIDEVQARYRADAEKASGAGLTDVAHLYWAIVRELDRAARIALTGIDPGDAGTVHP